MIAFSYHEARDLKAAHEFRERAVVHVVPGYHLDTTDILPYQSTERKKALKEGPRLFSENRRCGCYLSTMSQLDDSGNVRAVNHLFSTFLNVFRFARHHRRSNTRDTQNDSGALVGKLITLYWYEWSYHCYHTDIFNLAKLAWL